MKKVILNFILTSMVVASELSVSIASHHFGNSDGLDEFNPGIEYVADSGIVVGTFKNSYSKNTTYVGYQVKHNQFGFAIGVARYEGIDINTPEDIVPIGRVTVDVGMLRIGFIPAFYKDTKGIVTLQLVYKNGGKK